MKRAEEILYEQRDSQNIAVIDEEGRHITYSELYNSSLYLSLQLEEQKCMKNVLLYTGNSIEFAIGLFSIWMSNRSAVLVDTKMNKKDIIEIIKFCESDTIIYSKKVDLNRLVCRIKIMPVLCNDKMENIWKSQCDNDLAILFPTSGTTQNPRYAMLNHSGIISECEALKEAHNFCELTRYMIMVPITSSCGCLGQLVPVLYSGGQIIMYQGELNILRLARAIRETVPNILVCTSSVLSLLVHSVQVTENDLSSVDRIISAGEKSNVELFDQLKRKFGIDIITQAYGLTETSSAVSGSSIDRIAPYHSVGKVLKHFQVRIKMGEIQVKGNAVMKGYYKNYDLTNQVFDGEWFKTGDIGFIDNQGYLYIKGRIRNIIIVGGKNVFAEEVENIMLNMPEICSAHVYAEKSNLTGEKITADVTIKKECGITEQMIRDDCRKRMKPYMVPKIIHIVDDIKLNSARKISRTNGSV